MNYRIATLLAIALLLVSSAVRGQDSSSPAHSPERVAELISQLSHEKYSVREDATSRLTESGVAVLPELLKACTSENSETAWRATQILEQIGLEGDVNDLKLVIRGLISVAGQGHPHFQRRCQKLAARYSEYKSEVAVQKIRAMGGQVNETPGYGVAQAGVRWVVPAGPVRVIDRMEIEAKIVERVRAIEPEAVKVKDLVEELKKDEPQQEAKPQVLEEPDANGREDRDGDCGTFDDDEGGEQEQVQQVEAIVELDVVPEETAPEEDTPIAEEPFELLIRDIDDAPIGLQSSPTSQVYRSITIDANWTGGVEGLSYLSQVNNLNYVQLQGIKLTPAVFEQIAKIKTLNQLGIQECSFSVPEIQKFAAEHPELNMYVTGKAVLGVMPTQSAGGDGAGCELNQVIEGSPAFKAGLQPGDVIVSVDEHKVVDFPTLTYTVAGREVGDTVHVKALRDGEELEFKITLGPRGAILP